MSHNMCRLDYMSDQEWGLFCWISGCFGPLKYSWACMFCYSVPKRKDVYIVLTGAVWFIFLYFFWKIGDPFPILSPKHGQFDISKIQTAHSFFLCLLKYRHKRLCCNNEIINNNANDDCEIKNTVYCWNVSIYDTVCLSLRSMSYRRGRLHELMPCRSI